MIALLAWAVAGALLCKATLHVSRKPISHLELPSVYIMAHDGARLEGWFQKATIASGRCVVLLHGVADSRQGSAGFAPTFIQAGYAALIPDSRAHGTSGGKQVTFGVLEKEDLMDWIVWLRAHGCSSIYALGESLGAAVLIQALGSGAGLRAAVAECPFFDLWSIAEYRLKRQFAMPGILGAGVVRAEIASAFLFARLVYGLDLRQASPAASMPSLNTPLLLIHGMEDRETPPEHSIRLADLNRKAELWLVPGAGHTGAAATAGPEFRRRVLAWFASH